MKTRIISFGALAAAALALISCVQKEIEVSIIPAGEGIPFEIGLNAPDTKTACNNLVTSWTAGDQVNVFHAVAGTADYVSDGAFSYNGDTQKFDGTLASELDPAKSYDWYFFYPYSKYITTPANGADGGYTMVAPFSFTQTESNNTAHLIRLPLAGKITADAGAPVVAQMHHQASIVKIVVTNNSGVPMVFPQVKFQAPVNVAGNYCVAFTDPENPVFAEHATASKGNTVTVLSEWVTAKAAQSTYYAAVKPFTAAAASELKVTVGDYSKTVNLAAARTFAPGMVYTFNFNYDKAVTIAKLPFSFTGEGGQEALLAMDGVTAKGLGTDYGETHVPYVVKFDTQDDYIQVRYNEAAGKATMGVKKIGGNGESTIDVMGSVDGIEFTKIETLTVVGASNAIVNLTTTKTINSSYRCIRFVFNKASNVGVGPISILKPSSDPELIVTDVANISPVGGNGQVAYTVKNTSDDIQVEDVTGCVASATASSGKVNYTIKPNYDYKTATGTIVLKSKSKASLTATINLSQLGSNLKIDNKTTKTQEILIPYDKTSVTASVLSDYFGWSAEVTPAESMNLSLSPTSGSASLEAGSVTISSNTAGAADVLTLGTIVFKRVDEDTQTRTVTVKKDAAPSGNYYTKVTSITSGGKYLLVSEYGGTKKICSGLISSYALPLSDATISSNKIASNTVVDSYAVTITSVSGGYTIVNSNGQYFVLSSDLKNVALGTSAPATPWTLTKHTDNSFIFVNAAKDADHGYDGSTRSIFIGNSGNSCKYYASTNFGKTNYATTYLTLYKYQ